tara:strand:+ start:204 stop:572 length:369 start_codon:yes stop_codon:yes gene_type:complete
MSNIRRLKYKKIITLGETIKVKTLAEHDMETGVRRDKVTGVIYPRLILQNVTASFNGINVFEANWFSGVSANPYLAFFIKPTTSGLLQIKWRDDHANITYKRGYLKVLDKNGREIYPINFKL